MRDSREDSAESFRRDNRDDVGEPKRTIADASDSSEAPTQSATHFNRLLRALPADSYAQLAPRLEPIHLAHKYVLWEPDKPIRWAFFPQTAVCSLLVPLVEAAPVEAATVGREGFAGVPVVLGADATSTLAVAQVPGDALRVPADVLREAMEADRHLFTLLLRYAQALQEQTSQSVACNGRHSMDERCARWLLMTHDRVGGDEFHLSHHYLAQMLGVRRATVTVAAGMLQHAGLIRYNRARVTVLDREGLEQASCECYRIVKAKYDRLLA